MPIRRQRRIPTVCITQTHNPMGASMRPRNVLFGALPLMLAASALYAETPSKTVDYSDLNLQKPKHVAMLYRRIELAAGHVCKPLAGRDAEHVILFRKCVDESVERAVNDV